MKKKKIIFNYLPPGIDFKPSPAFSILKSHMAENGYPVDVIYWNILMRNITKDFKEDPDLSRLLPFLKVMAENALDDQALDRIRTSIQSDMPHKKALSGDCYDDFLDEKLNKIYEIIDSEIKKINFDNVLLFGITSKFDQWIPGAVLAARVKTKHPEVKIVVGGFMRKEAAEMVMNVCNDFDFAIWGEGEFPLLELANKLVTSDTAYNEIPRLIYRDGKELYISKCGTGQSFNLDSGLYPDYSDFFSYLKNTDIELGTVKLPVEEGRGCNWNKCKFCVLNQGYTYREKSPEAIVAEIDYMTTKYKVFQYFFVGNDLIGKDVNRFEKMLDLLIQLSREKDYDYRVHGEIISHNLSPKIIKKMFLAGMNELQIGYEAITDTLLKKMDKRSRFADNILFMKYACKYGIKLVGANILSSLPDEEEKDVVESIKNLHYLRFLLGENDFKHSFSTVFVAKGSRYFNMLKEEDKISWNKNRLAYLLPQKYLTTGDRFDYLAFSNEDLNYFEWKKFPKIDEYYTKTKFEYKLFDHDGVVYYREYCNGENTASIMFDEPEYVDVMKEANGQVVSLNDVYERVRKKHPDVTLDKIKTCVEELNAEYLLYRSEDYSNIITILDTDKIN